ncbi:MAG TPA: hypothetical protein DCS60_00650, partial [Opitutae bacterium]|nr:hypothetical protein [Opitutae bacterium]
HQAISVAEGNIASALFEGLVTQPARGDTEILPGVASSWTVNAKKSKFVFSLNPNAVWSDGTPIDANTFVESYKRILTPRFAAQNAVLFYDILNAEEFHKGEITDFSKVGVSAISNYELEIELNRSVPYFLQKLKHFAWFPVPIHEIQANGGLYSISNSWASNPNLVSNGPYVLASWQRNLRISIVKNKRYWDAEKVSVASIEFHLIENTQSQYRAFQAGQIDVTEEIPSELKSANLPNARFDPVLSTAYLVLNTESSPLNSSRARIALSQAIDRKLLIKAVLKSGTPANRFTPKSMPGYPLRSDLANPALVTLAEIELDALRANGPLTMIVSNRDVSIDVAEALQNMWEAKLGIDVRIQNMEFRTFLTRLDEGDYDIGYIAWTGDYAHAYTFLDVLRSDGLHNRSRWKHSGYDNLLDKSLTQHDSKSRLETLYKAESLLMEEMPIIPISWKTKDYFLSSRVQNWPASLVLLRTYKYVHLQN